MYHVCTLGNSSARLARWHVRSESRAREKKKTCLFVCEQGFVGGAFFLCLIGRNGALCFIRIRVMPSPSLILLLSISHPSVDCTSPFAEHRSGTTALRAYGLCLTLSASCLGCPQPQHFTHDPCRNKRFRVSLSLAHGGIPVFVLFPSRYTNGAIYKGR